MAISMSMGGSNLSIDITTNTDAGKAATELEKLNVQIQKSIEGEQRLKTKIAEQRLELQRYKQSIKELALARQLMLKDTQFLMMNRQEQRQTLMALDQEKDSLKALALQKEKHIDLSKRALIEQKGTTAGLKTQVVALEEHISTLEEASGKVNIFSQAWNKFGLIFTRVLDALIAFMIIDTITKSIMFLVTSLFEANQLFDTLKARLSALEPDSLKVTEIWKELAKITVTTPFKLDEVVNAAALLKTYGVDIAGNMKAIADWAAVTDKDLNSTAVAFGKIANYSPRTGLMLTTRGLSIAAFNSYFSRYGDRVVALNKLIEDSFGQTSEKLSETAEGLLTNISDIWTQIAQKLGAASFYEVKDILQQIYDIMTLINQQAGSLSVLGFGLSTFFKQPLEDLKLFKTILAGLRINVGGLNLKLLDTSVQENRLAEIYQLLTNKSLSGLERGRLLEEQKQIFELLGFSTKEVEKQISLNKHAIETDRMKLMLLNAQTDALTHFDAKRKVVDAGLASFIKGLVGGVSKGTSPEEIAYRSAQQEFLSGLAVPVTDAQRLEKIKDLMKGATKEKGKGSADLFRYIQTIMELLDEFDKTKEKAEKKFKIEPLDAYINKLLDLTTKFQEFQYELSRTLLEPFDTGNTLASERISSLYKQLDILDSEIKKRGGTSPSMTGVFLNYKDETEKLALYDKELTQLKKIQQAIKDMEKVSDNFTDAWIKGLKQTREELKNWREELVNATLQSIRAFGGGLLDELIFGKQSREITTKLDDLRFKLLQVQGDKQNIKYVEDQEASLLAQINELEYERHNIVFSLLKDAIDPIYQKLKELAINRIFDEMFPKEKEGSVYQLTKDLYEKTGSIFERIPGLEEMSRTKMIANATLYIGNAIISSDSPAGFLNGIDFSPDYGSNKMNPFDSNRINNSIQNQSNRSIQFNFGNVYGVDDFNQRIDKAIRTLNNSRV